jgi:nucleoid DNA-binding protein
MFEKTEICEEVNSKEHAEPRERMEATLRKLQILKDRISELRAHCEELQISGAANQSVALRCEECGRTIESGQEVEAKNFGEKTRHYHKECFRKLWLR